MSVGSSFENSALKSSFSLSSLRTGGGSGLTASGPLCKASVERPYHSLTKKRKDPNRESWRRSWGSQYSGQSVLATDDLWAALQHNYDYIMDNHIIDTCKEANGELLASNSSVLPPSHGNLYNRQWSLQQLIMEFTDMWQWLTAMQDQIYSSPENSSNRTLRLTHMSELTQAEPRLEKLVEQAGAILARIPEASEEVVWRVKHIRVKWESVRQLLSVEDASADGDASGVVDNTEHEIRCLRRWLHTMEGRLPPPSAAAARGCSRQELLRKQHEYQVLQRDVQCHGRIVGAVLRRRGEGCTGASAGGGGLERRWQLLFLRALEWQCHLDACLAGLENREDTCVPTDSDDEPALKQRRLSKRTSPRRAPRTTPERTTPERTTGINGHRYTPTSSCESDESYSEEDNDENYSSLVSYRYNSDSSQFDILPSGCAEHDLEASAAMELEGNERGVPGTHESTPVNEGTRGNMMGDSQLDLVDGVCCTTNDATMYDDDSANQIPVQTPPTVIKRSKRSVNSSKFNQSGRMSKNCATYYFKHRDTDSDRQMIDTDEKTQEESSEEEWTYAGGEKQPLEGDMHLIDGEGDVAMEDQASKDKTEGCVPEKAKNIALNETQSIHNENEEAVKAKLEQNAQQNLCKENITRLVNQADEWVQKQVHHQGSPVSVKKIKVSRNFKPLSFDGEGKGVNKMSRINEWLRQHSDGKADNSLQSVDSYDASGECTTGESEADKQSVTSEEPSLDTYRNMTCSMEMSMISSTSTITPSNNTTPVHHGKVTLRKKKTNASGTRPWSVSCLSQLTLGTNEPTGVSGSSLNTTPVQPTNTTSAYSRVSGMSISESALNTIVSPSHNMMSHKLNKAKQGKVQSSTSSVKTAIQGHISSTTTINDACISCYENADLKQCSMRRKRLKLRRRQQAHLSGELDFEDIRPEQRTKMSKRQDRLVKCSSFSGQPTERIEDRLERNTASDPSSSRKNRFDTSSASGNDSEEGMTTQQPAILPCSKRTEQSTTDQDPSSAELQAENVRPSFKVGPAGGWVRGRLSLTERDKDRTDMLELNLGDPALLWDVSADKDSDIDRSIRTGGTEEHSSFSEQAWDSYQEKYNSEPYSEAPDSDAARQLLECDDYRAFLDSQSDCCSSLSAHPDHDTSPHNFTRRRLNLDDHREKSLPRYRKPGKVELTDSSLPRRIKKTSLSSAERKKNLMDSLERSKISSSADNTEIVRRRKILHDSTDRRMSKKTSLSDSFDRLNLQPHGHRRRHSSNTTSSDVNSSFEYTSINHQNRPDLLDTLNRRTRKHSANSERSRDSSELQNQADSSLNSADSRQSHNDESLESYAGDLMPVLRKRGFSLSLQVRNDAGNISDAMEFDLERYDIRSLVQRSQSQLEFTESMFAKQETSPDLIRSGDYNEIIATCRKNINCLETILVGAAEGDHHILLPAYCKEIKALSARWSMLRAAAARRGGARRLRRELAALRDAVRDATQAALAADARPQLHTRHHLTRRIDELKEQLSTLLEYKVSMLKLNVSVHRLLADMGLNDPEVNVSGGVTETVCHALKDEVAELYRAWEDAHQRTSAELISLENVLESWMSWEDGLKELQLALNGDSATLRLIESALCAGHSDSVIPHVRDMANILSEKKQQKAETSGSLSDSGISDAGSDRPLSERERRLAALRRAARVLEAALAPGSHVLKAMTKRMEQTETELRTLQISCRALIMRTAARAGELKADNGCVLVRNAANSDSACPKTASDDPEDEPSGSSFPTKRWLWRIFKSALPFQLCMLALLCAAYLLDHPRCCDAVNNLGMSFSPQLRYVRGPPPI